MISVSNVLVEFGGEALFKGISFHIGKKERIGLAGKNGAGKTTLLRLLYGEQEPSGGQVVVPEHDSLGYLPQEKVIRSSKSVIQETLSAFGFLNEVKQEFSHIQDQLGTRTDYESGAYAKLMDRMGELSHILSVSDDDQLEGKAVKVLRGLGFLQSELSRIVNTFSLGWQMRIELAKLLLRQPGLLMLDEPTNHLDIDAIQWLEDYLKTYRGSILIVSHDRSFLDKLTNRTLEINHGKIYDYKVSYSKYLILRDERVDQQVAQHGNQQKQIKEIESFIERFRYTASKAKQVQSRIKQLEKLERVNVDDLDKAGIHFRFPPAPRSGKVVVEGNQVFKSYGDKSVLRGLDFQIIRGEKVAFVGRNGEGKTTLSKILAKQLSYDGELKYGHNVQVAYYAQDQWEMLDPSKTIFETLDDIAVGDIRKRLKSILGAFLFQGEDVDKKISVLSGGEKARLSLAKLLLVPSNLLILDEPTNHLDILSKDILKNALLQYDGTLILVSHDRDFLSGLSERFYEFKDHHIKQFIGTLSEYLEKRNIEQLRDLEMKGNTKATKEKSSLEKKQDWEQKKETDRQDRKLKKELQTIEQSIERTENKLQVVNQKLAEPEKYAEEINNGSLYKEHKELETQLGDMYVRWESLQ